MKKGSRNLLILGIVATLITIVTTVINLFIYNQNDAKLDRSRPGYVFEEETPKNKNRIEIVGD